MRKFFIFIVNIPRYTIQGLIWVYKKCISPLLPSVCKFTPSCSTFAMQSIQEWGFFKGSYFAMKRIFRCNPWSKGGLDLVKLNIKGDYKWLM